jgi:heme/copper-type cytochrome/quinol oxidase subunit 2
MLCWFELDLFALSLIELTYVMLILIWLHYFDLLWIWFSCWGGLSPPRKSARRQHAEALDWFLLVLVILCCIVLSWFILSYLEFAYV